MGLSLCGDISEVVASAHESKRLVMLNVGSLFSCGDELVRRPRSFTHRSMEPLTLPSFSNAWKRYWILILARNSLHACQNSCVNHVSSCRSSRARIHSSRSVSSFSELYQVYLRKVRRSTTVDTSTIGIETLADVADPEVLVTERGHSF